MVLINETDIPFITSDNPAIFYYQDMNQQIAQTYIPLKPSIALLIAPDLDFSRPSFEDVKGYGFGLYPFPNFMQPVLEKIDPYHCHQMVFIAKK